MVLAVATASSALSAGGNYEQGWGVRPGNFYLGASAGMANQSDYDDGTTTAGKIFGGVRVTNMLGAEVGYAKLGESENTGTDGRLASNIKSDTSALYAAGVAYLPLAPRVELMGKAGVLWWEQDNNKNVALIDEQTQSNDSGVSPLLGAGVQYRLNQNLHIRGEWEHAFGTGEAGDSETDVDMLTVGVSLSTL